MKAKSVNEAIKHLGPKSQEELESSYKNLSPNDKLITGIKENISWLVELGLKEGGDQLWYEAGGPMGAEKSLHFPFVTDYIVRIEKVIETETNERGFYRKAPFIIVYRTVWCAKVRSGNKYQTQLFYRKYKPIDDRFKYNLNLCQRNIEQIKLKLSAYE